MDILGLLYEMLHNEEGCMSKKNIKKPFLCKLTGVADFVVLEVTCDFSTSPCGKTAVVVHSLLRGDKEVLYQVVTGGRFCAKTTKL